MSIIETIMIISGTVLVVAVCTLLTLACVSASLSLAEIIRGKWGKWV